MHMLKMKWNSLSCFELNDVTKTNYHTFQQIYGMYFEELNNACCLCILLNNVC